MTMNTPIDSDADQRLAPVEWYATVQRVGRMSGKDVAESIAASHPTEMEMPEAHGADELAMFLLQGRHSKREIMNLLRWVLMGCPSHTDSDELTRRGEK